MTPQELKNSILQLAIQGKLVEQRAEEGTDEELYKQIQAEKQALIKAGKIKKEKPLPMIAEDEIPFDIPNSWKWVRYSDLFDIGSAIRIHQTDWKTEGIPFFRGRELVRLAKTGDPDAEIFISHELYEVNKAKGGVPQKGDLLVTAVGTLGKVYVVKGTKPFYYKDAYILRYNNFSALFSDYFKYVIEAPFNQAYIAQGSMGTTVAQLTIQKAKKMLCPFPPLAEQKRIVAKIEELLPLIERYEKAWRRLEDFNKRFPEDMQKSILQMAIQGKLVEQRPEEGTGEELYRQIQAAKTELINAGIIKQDRRTEGLSEPTDDEKPFDIPDTWKFVYLGSILNKLTDGTHKTPKYTTSGVKFVSVKDMSSGLLSLEQTKFISMEEHAELYSRCNPERGDMLLSKVGTTGVPAIVDTDEPFSLFVSVALLKYSHLYIFEKFLYYLLKSPLVQQQATENTRGVGNKNWVLDAISKTVIVLPPLDEQKRIVAKLEEILPLCDRLNRP